MSIALRGLSAAVLRDDTHAVQRLLKAGEDATFKQAGPVEALYLAAALGHTAIARLLVSAGVDIKRPAGSDRTPLHAAAMKGHTQIVEALLAAGTKWDVRDDDGATPEDLARLCGAHSAAHLLRSAAQREAVAGQASPATPAAAHGRRAL